ncbi:MAG: hypothetical protein A2046_06665 [Bacteroidetes bacterium GWA2_30_7]|nr:MAG: hypothetical protein A2046_06665 [Bacteroidetes bacterium GWA2_30_7]
MDKVNNARARAFIHLFLKVKFGIIDFLEREKFITDDTGDGGIDGYYIDQENKKLYFIQSKFRVTENNFENKEITFDELLSMDIERIASGEIIYENEQKYNDKIQKFIKELQNISDLPKFEYKIILLANIKNSLQAKINKLTGGFQAEIYNYEKCYNELVFPLVSGTYYNIKELKITINVDSNSAGHRIDYYVKTKHYECNVNALFIPTIEIAKILSKYKNSILHFNPRSYLDLCSGSVNAEIAKSITNISTNEFALFNNGITMLSDNTNYSDKVGRRNKAEIIVTNPQIINGGQTAYTLSIIYDNCLKNNKTLDIFNDKEVLLKIITFSDENTQSNKFNGNRLQLIEDISIATNQQTPVTEADRRANDKVQVELQKLIFEEFGLYYERKRGEYGDGLRQGYINRNKIIDREQFLRICLSAQNNPTAARRSGQSVLFIKSTFDNILPNASFYRKYIFAYKTYEKISQFFGSFGTAVNYGRYAVTCVVANKFTDEVLSEKFEEVIESNLKIVLNKWLEFDSFVRSQKHNEKYFSSYVDKTTGQRFVETNWNGYYKGSSLIEDLNIFFKLDLFDNQ